MPIVEVAVFTVLVIAIAVVGLRVGMMVAPRLTRWVEHDEERHDDEH